MLRLRRCELIPLFTPLSHCHKQRQTHSLASRILFAVIVPPPLKFLIALCCLLIHALSFPQITMGYSVGIILAQCETMYEPSIRCVNCTQHTSYIQWRWCRHRLDGHLLIRIFFLIRFCNSVLKHASLPMLFATRAPRRVRCVGSH